MDFLRFTTFANFGAALEHRSELSKKSLRRAFINHSPRSLPWNAGNRARSARASLQATGHFKEPLDDEQYPGGTSSESNEPESSFWSLIACGLA